MDYKKLIAEAKKALKKSYSPYSKFKVGAAVITKSGKIFTGTNIESASYGLTLCAEKSAVASAVSSGSRDIKAIAVVSSKNNPCYPCGACRQFIIEFGKDIEIVTIKSKSINVEKVASLLPNEFELREKKCVK